MNFSPADGQNGMEQSFISLFLEKEPIRPPGDSLLNKLFFLVHGEKQYVNVGIFFFDFPGCFQALEIGMEISRITILGLDFSRSCNNFRPSPASPMTSRSACSLIILLTPPRNNA